MPEAAASVVTVLTSSDEEGRPTGFLTKRVTASGVKGNSFPPTYVSREVPVSSIHELAQLLDILAAQPHSCVIRGRKLANALTVHRRVAAEGDADRAYGKQACQWFCLDVDKLPLLFLGCEAGTLPLVLARKAVQLLLPSAFHGVSFYWQASSSHGYKKKEDVDRLSMHLWFWLDRPLTDEEYKKYILHLNRSIRVEYYYEGRAFDPALHVTVQPHFTADPILAPGIEPLPYPRRGLDLWDQHIVPIAAEIDRLEPAAWVRHFDRFGDDKDGFWHPILGVTGCYVHEQGKVGLLPAPREALKERIRQAIDRAEKGSRSKDEIARYRSDKYLDRALEDAEGKGFGQAGTDEQAEAAAIEFVYCRYTDDYFNKKHRYATAASGVSRFRRSKKDVTKNDFFLKNIQHVDMVRAFPGKRDQLVDDEGLEVWSSWPGRKLEPTYKPVHWFEEHIAYLCDDDPRVTRPLLDWIAHLLARPGERIMWAPILGSSREGVGKSLVGVLLGKLIRGTEFLTETNITEKYKDFLIDNELAVCEEIRIDAKLNATDALKVFITEPRVNVRRFGRPHEKIRCFCHFWFTTNYRDAVPLHQDGDRRYLPIFTDREPKSTGYYEELWRHVDNDASDVLGWALQRDLRHFNPHLAPPQTEAGKQMAELARPRGEQAVALMVQERQPPFNFKVWFTTEVHQQLRVQCSLQRLVGIVKRHNGEYRRLNVEVEHERRTRRAIFIFDDAGEGLAGLPEPELYDMALAETRRRARRAIERKAEDEIDLETAKEEIRKIRRVV